MFHFQLGNDAVGRFSRRSLRQVVVDQNGPRGPIGRHVLRLADVRSDRETRRHSSGTFSGEILCRKKNSSNSVSFRLGIVAKSSGNSLDERRRETANRNAQRRRNDAGRIDLFHLERRGEKRRRRRPIGRIPFENDLSRFAGRDAIGSMVSSKSIVSRAKTNIFFDFRFQSQVTTRQHASALIRCFRYKSFPSEVTNRVERFHSFVFSAQIVEVLVEFALARKSPAIAAFRFVLEILAGGFVLSSECRAVVRLKKRQRFRSDRSALTSPWRNDSTPLNIFRTLSREQRNEITGEAQVNRRSAGEKF